MTASRVAVLVTCLVGAATVAGSAASIAVDAGHLGAAREAAAQCQGTPPVTIDDNGGSPAEVTTVTVSSIDGGACDGSTLKITLVGAGGAAMSTERSAVISSGDTQKVFNYASEHIELNDVAGASTVFEP